MDSNSENVPLTVDTIIKHLSSELGSIIRWISKEVGESGSPFLQLPDPTQVDVTLEEMAAWVVRTSNAYGKVARMAGIARAELKLAERSYKKAWRKALANAANAKNQAQREAAATDASEKEADRLAVAESMVAIVEQIESSLRLSSESARKIYDKMNVMSVADSRQHHAEQKGSGAFSSYG